MDNLKICLHDGIFHADEVFSASCLKLINDNHVIIRSRDEDVIASSDMRIDIGKKYNHDTLDYDHHQEDFNERYTSPHIDKFDKGPKLSGFGLIWRHYHKDVIIAVTKDDKLTDDEITYISDKILKQLVVAVDTFDNGEQNIYRLDKGYYRIPSMMRFISILNPTWLEDKDGKYFEDARLIASTYLSREILSWYAIVKSKDTLVSLVKQNGDSKMLILDKYLSWAGVFSLEPELFKNIELVIYPMDNGNWNVQSTYINYKLDDGKYPKYYSDGKKRDLRCPSLSSFRGKDMDELKNLSNLDIVFVHMGGFISGTTNKEDAIKLAELYLENNERN